ncbi:MAG TPA: YaeQ family protein [Nitrospiria bacterium]
MTLNAAIYKAALQIADMDRHYYHDHELTLARHPSETDERLMVRVLAFARHAGERLSFAQGRLGAGLKTAPDEPDLWQKDLTGALELWIEVGLPDERILRQACHRAQQVVVYAYGGPKADRWWEQNRASLEKAKNLTVITLSAGTTRALAALVQRDLTLHCTIQDGQVWIGAGEERVEVVMGILLQRRA